MSRKIAPSAAKGARDHCVVARPERCARAEKSYGVPSVHLATERVLQET